MVHRYCAEDRVRHFGCRQQLICMVFAQLTWRESLRDIEACLIRAYPEGPCDSLVYAAMDIRRFLAE